MAIAPWLQLAMTEGIGPILAHRAVQTLGSPQAVCGASSSQLRGVEGIGQAKSQKIYDAIRAAAAPARAEEARAADLGITLISFEDDRYPALLKNIPDPPLVLYVRGAPEPRDLNAMAIVGSRRCTYYGREQAERFGALLSGAGFTVVSGGARGVDSAAHRGALSHPQGRTIAVLGCGIDRIYPPENKDLFALIAGRGVIVSEYPLGTPPLADNFPRRNRIISGISRGVLVVEADERSGALVTARQAADDHNRPVFAIPGRVDNPLSAGPHQLIRDGAVLTATLQDILDGLGPLPASTAQPLLFDQLDPNSPPEPEVHAKPPGDESQAPTLSERQRRILDAMGCDAATVDQIVQRSGCAAHEVLQEMTVLSLRGLVRRVDGQTFISRRPAQS